MTRFAFLFHIESARRNFLMMFCQLNLPKWLGSETHSILKQLLERNVDKRLGSGKSTMFKVKGVQAIKQHPFFKVLSPASIRYTQQNSHGRVFFVGHRLALTCAKEDPAAHCPSDHEQHRYDVLLRRVHQTRRGPPEPCCGHGRRGETLFALLFHGDRRRKALCATAESFVR